MNLSSLATRKVKVQKRSPELCRDWTRATQRPAVVERREFTVLAEGNFRMQILFEGASCCFPCSFPLSFGT